MSDYDTLKLAPELSLWQKPIMSAALDESAPNVFISYSQSQDDLGKHREWVANFGRKLLGLGIKVICDMNFDGSQTLPSFMREGIQKSKYVICVCSSSYTNKIKNTRRQSGARDEYKLILDRAESQPLKDFVIPILKDSLAVDTPQKVPAKFKKLYCWNFDDEKYVRGEFAKLVERILEVREKIAHIQYSQQRGALGNQKISDVFHLAVAKYWRANSGSIEEARLSEFITSGDVFKAPDESCATFAREDGFDTRHDGKVLFSVGRWDESYAGDKEIFSLLRGNSDNE